MVFLTIWFAGYSLSLFIVPLISLPLFISYNPNLHSFSGPEAGQGGGATTGTAAADDLSSSMVDCLISKGSAYGLILEQGVYVAGIQPGSRADKEGEISVGERIAKV